MGYLIRFLVDCGGWFWVFLVLEGAAVVLDLVQLARRSSKLSGIIIGSWCVILLLGSLSFFLGLHHGFATISITPPAKIPAQITALARGLSGAAWCLILLVPLTLLDGITLMVAAQRPGSQAATAQG